MWCVCVGCHEVSSSTRCHSAGEPTSLERHSHASTIAPLGALRASTHNRWVRVPSRCWLYVALWVGWIVPGERRSRRSEPIRFDLPHGKQHKPAYNEHESTARLIAARGLSVEYVSLVCSHSHCVLVFINWIVLHRSTERETPPTFTRVTPDNATYHSLLSCGAHSQVGLVSRRSVSRLVRGFFHPTFAVPSPPNPIRTPVGGETPCRPIGGT